MEKVTSVEPLGQPHPEAWSSRRLDPPAGAPEDLVDMVRDFEPEPMVATTVLDPWRAQALAGVLGTEPPAEKEGDPLPLGWHEVYFRDPLARAGLAEDGHASDHPLMPPRRPRRRVFGGADLHQTTPLLLGNEVTKTSSLADCRIRQGRTGWLLLLTEVHSYAVAGLTTLTERRNVVLRHDDPDRPHGQKPPIAADSAGEAETGGVEQRLAFDPVTLFRFSALTYNPHRIHYDRDYATVVEGHEDLLVHGPLTALTVLELARIAAPPARLLTRYSFTLCGPAYAGRDLRVRGRLEGDQWSLSAAQDGRLVVTATAR